MNEQVFEVNCGFFDSINRDRLYSSEEMNRPYKRIITNGVFATPKGNPSTDLQVVSANNEMNIIVKKGEGLFGDKWFENPADIAITVPLNTSTVPRKDSVLVRIDKRISARKGYIAYKVGTPNSIPEPPTLNSDKNIIEYRIANIYVTPETVLISQDTITDLRGSSECPWVTSLINQVDTSVLYDQWQTAYQNYYDKSTSDFEEYEELRQAEFSQFLENLTSDLSVATNIIMLNSDYISKTDVTNIPIGIPSYNPTTDILQVYVNGLRVTEGLHYSLNSNKTSIDLISGLKSGQAVNFLVLKSVIGADLQTTVTMIKTLDTKINNFMLDDGWQNLTLENDAIAYDDTNVPSLRKYNNQIFISGAIKGMTELNTTICTLPIGMRPSKKHIYSSNTINDSAISSNVVLEIGTNGEIKILSKSGVIGSTDMLYINTNFILG